MFVTPKTLQGCFVSLEPLTLDAHDELVAAVRDGELWKLWFTNVPSPEGMRNEILRRLSLQESGTMMPYVVRVLHTNQVCGMTSFMNIDAVHRRLEIGSTWYAQSVQRTAVNTECKLLMLQYAFEQLACIAVEFRTHWMNHASREAILRLGAKQDGVLRNHQRMADGSYRDTVVFSIINHEWLVVKKHLTGKLDL